MKDAVLSPKALLLIRSKRDLNHQIIFGTLLQFFQKKERFPVENDKISLVEIIQSIDDVLEIRSFNHDTIMLKCLCDTDRTLRRFKQEIRLFFYNERRAKA